MPQRCDESVCDFFASNASFLHFYLTVSNAHKRDALAITSENVCDAVSVSENFELHLITFLQYNSEPQYFRFVCGERLRSAYDKVDKVS